MSEEKSQDQEAQSASGQKTEKNAAESMSACSTPGNSVDSNKGGGSAVAFIAIVLALLALAGLLFMGPNFSSRIDSLKFEMDSVSQSVQAVDKKIQDVDDSVQGLKNKLGGFEKTVAILELRRMLNTLETINKNIPESTAGKTESIKENILSILSDLGAGKFPEESEASGKGPEAGIIPSEEAIKEEEPKGAEMGIEQPRISTEPAQTQPLTGLEPRISIEPAQPQPSTEPEKPQTPKAGAGDDAKAPGSSGAAGTSDAGSTPDNGKKNFGKIEIRQE